MPAAPSATVPTPYSYVVIPIDLATFDIMILDTLRVGFESWKFVFDKLSLVDCFDTIVYYLTCISCYQICSYVCAVVTVFVDMYDGHMTSHVWFWSWQAKVWQSQGGTEQQSRWFDWPSRMDSMMEEMGILGHGMLRYGMVRGCISRYALCVDSCDVSACSMWLCRHYVKPRTPLMLTRRRCLTIAMNTADLHVWIISNVYINLLSRSRHGPSLLSRHSLTIVIIVLHIQRACVVYHAVRCCHRPPYCSEPHLLCAFDISKSIWLVGPCIYGTRYHVLYWTRHQMSYHILVFFLRLQFTCTYIHTVTYKAGIARYETVRIITNWEMWSSRLSMPLLKEPMIWSLQCMWWGGRVWHAYLVIDMSVLKLITMCAWDWLPVQWYIYNFAMVLSDMVSERLHGLIASSVSAINVIEPLDLRSIVYKPDQVIWCVSDPPINQPTVSGESGLNNSIQIPCSISNNGYELGLRSVLHPLLFAKHTVCQLCYHLACACSMQNRAQCSTRSHLAASLVRAHSTEAFTTLLSIANTCKRTSINMYFPSLTS